MALLENALAQSVASATGTLGQATKAGVTSKRAASDFMRLYDLAHEEPAGSS